MITAPEIKTEPEIKIRPKTPSELLLHAALYLEEFGWTQYHWGGGPRCLEGAILAVGGTNDDRRINCRRFLVPYTSELPWVWNDFGGRTKEEVISVLRKAAYDAAQEEGVTKINE